MAATVEVTYRSQISAVTTLTGDYVSPADPTFTEDQLGETAVLNASSTPPATKSASFQVTMSEGAATIDLTALPGRTADETIDLTGLKVQVVKFRNLSTNANLITIADPGAENNPYELLGGSFTLELLPGQSIMILGDDATPDVASGAKEISVTGTGSQKLEVHIIAG